MSHERIGDREARNYVAYLLRLWRETSGEPTRWRASLQDPHSGERVGFGSLEELFEFLHRQVGAALILMKGKTEENRLASFEGPRGWIQQ